MGIDLKKEIKLSDLFKRRGSKGFDDFAGTVVPELAETVEPEVAERAAEPKRKRKRLSFSAGQAAEVAERAAEPKRKRLSFAAGRAPKAPKAPKAPTLTHDGTATSEIPLMRAFNLLPKEEGRDARRARPRAQLVLAVVGTLLFAGVAGAYFLTSAGVTDKRGTRDSLRTQLQALQAEAAKAGPAKLPDPALASEKNLRTYALEAAISGRVAWDRLLRELSLVLPDEVWLTGLVSSPPETGADPTAPPTPSTVTVSGYAYTQDGVAHMLSRLVLVPELSSVQLVSSQTALIGETEVFQFQISAVVKLPEGGAA